MLEGPIDTSVVYEGPRAQMATLTGSPVWGLGDRFAAFAERQGYRPLGVYRPMTPYGLGPHVEAYEAPTGAPVLRIPSYGMVAGEDWSLRAAEWKVFWILWCAGVEVLLVGGTSGTCDWRQGEEAVRPGDLVLPWTYFSLDAIPSGLPGTELENVLAERVALMDEPFCPSLSRELIREVGALDTARFRRVHGQDARIVLHRWQYGAGFESAGHSLFLREYGRSIGCPVITGDCVSPVLARVCGIHLGYYHVPSNWAEGLRPQNLAGSLDALYLETLPEVAATLELRLLARLAQPTDCRCRQLLRPRPPEYRRALSPPATHGEKAMPMTVSAEYRSKVRKPDDFDAFWDDVVRQASAIPLDAEVVPDPLRSSEDIEVFQVFYTSLEYVRIAAWYCRPARRAGRAPAIMLLPGYQMDPPIPKEWARKGYIALSVAPRGKLRSDRQFNPGYPNLLTHNIIDRHTYAYRGFYVDTWRGIDFLLSRPEVDPTRIGVTGSSQGGGLTITTAAMRSEVRAAAAGAPYLCGFMDAIELTHTYPYEEINDYLRLHPDRRREVEETVAYFDGISFADRISCPIIVNIGLQDNVCPPETGYALFDRIGAKDKQLYAYDGHGHDAGRFRHGAIVDRFFARHLLGREVSQ